MITPAIADSLADIEKDYPNQWVLEAMKIASHNQVLKLSYIIGILKRWEKEGRAEC